MFIAYIDPGSGALVWQLCIAAVMGALFYLSKIRSMIGRGFFRLFNRENSEPVDGLSKDPEKD
jgi:hypothetical protein